MSVAKGASGPPEGGYSGFDNPGMGCPCRNCCRGYNGYYGGGDGEVKEQGKEWMRPLTRDERQALKKELEEGCSDFIPYKGKGRFKEFFRKLAEDIVEFWLPALVIGVMSILAAGGIALAIIKIFKIFRA
jgi:hypothetical protein